MDSEKEMKRSLVNLDILEVSINKNSIIIKIGHLRELHVGKAKTAGYLFFLENKMR